MNPNHSSNMMSSNVGQQMSSQYPTPSQSMSANMSQNPAIGHQMDVAFTSGGMSGQMSGQTSGGQQHNPQMNGQSSQQQAMVGNMTNINLAAVCRVGHETVQDIVTKTAELFSYLRLMVPPSATQQALCQERQIRIKDMLKNIEILFKRLRKTYEKTNECMSTMDYIQIESIIPMKDEDCHKFEDKRANNPKVKQLDKEHKELMEELLLKNRQIKEIIDTLRAIVWEINTMLAIRKP